MSETFVTKIYVRESRNLSNFEIPLSSQSRKHLIITGKNGSGKTSLLKDLNVFLSRLRKFDTWLRSLAGIEMLRSQLLLAKAERPVDSGKVSSIETSSEEAYERVAAFGGVEAYFSEAGQLATKASIGTFIYAFFDANRHTSFHVPSGIQKFNLKPLYDPIEKAGEYFVQHLVNLKADRSFARDENDTAVVREIDSWFERFTNRLRQIIGDPNLKLEFDRSKYNFQIIQESRLPYELNTLSDGYSSIISIVAELILRMEAHQSKTYDLEGIVLIDEIETHLHVELQKSILPFLTDFFPRIQFVVTTHSPFVLSSISDATVCDLEKQVVINEDLSSYSSEVLIENYFQSDKYSKELIRKVEEYEKLAKATDVLKSHQLERLAELETFFDEELKTASDELAVKIQQIKMLKLG